MLRQVFLVNPPSNIVLNKPTDWVSSFFEAKERLVQQSYPCIVIFNAQQLTDSQFHFLNSLCSEEINSQLILIGDLNEPWVFLPSGRLPFRMIDKTKIEALEQTIEDAITHWHYLKVTAEKSLKKAEGSTHNILILKEISLKLLPTKSLHEIETVITKHLSQVSPILSCHFRMNQQSSLIASHPPQIHIEPVIYNNQKQGSLLFCFKHEDEIKEIQKSRLLSQVASIVSSHICRIFNFLETESEKQDWQATFDSFTDPLCITDLNFNILRGNRNYALLAKKELIKIQKENALNFCFDENEIQDIKQKPLPLTIYKSLSYNSQIHFYEIIIQEFSFFNNSSKSLFIHWRDLTLNVLEEIIGAQAKQKEDWGILGSSMAHELNNPLATQLSFLHLIQAEIDKNSPIKPLLQMIQEKSKQAQLAIEQILDYSRMDNAKAPLEIHSLQQIIEQAIAIFKMQFRDQNVEFMFLQKTDLELPLNKNQWMQNLGEIFTYLLRPYQNNNLQEGILFQIQINSQNQSPEIIISLILSNQIINNKCFSFTETQIIDKEFENNLNLLFIQDLIKKNQARVEFSSPSGVESQAIISFVRPDFPTGLSVFDRKI
ncbi:MAG: hypothetical protein K1X29_00665 [Bdellovibrionales bacterium]|nr:hypothetical protein [Bdellovibrionales bacterium]